MAKKKVFVGYDYHKDRHYKNLLLAWDKNREFDFDFNHQSADVSIRSTGITVIKRAISAKINASAYFLCLVGEKTSESCWVAWELEKAKELKKEACRREDLVRECNPKRTLGSWCVVGYVVHLRRNQEGCRRRLMGGG